MRELKFRAWVPDCKEMYRDVGYIPSSSDTRFTASKQTWCFRPDQAILMQYTGLKDKNGVEIYEGDVVRQNRYVITQVCAVEFIIDEGNGRITFTPPDWMWKLSACEVIGNIYENPDLLSKGA